MEVARLSYLRARREGANLASQADNPALKRLGWDRTNLLDLRQKARQIVRRFAIMTYGLNFDVVLKVQETAENTKEWENVPTGADPEKQEIALHLDQGPEIVISEGPLMISQKLVNLLLPSADRSAFFPHLRVDLPPAEHLVVSGTSALIRFLLTFETAIIDPGQLRAAFRETAQPLAEKLAFHKLSHNLFGASPPKKVIFGEINNSLLKMMELVANPLTNSWTVQAWWLLASLAEFSVVAESLGARELADRCGNLSSGKIGHALAGIHLMDLIEEGHVHSPGKSAEYIEKDIEGFSLAYNTFRAIFQYIFDRIKVIAV